MPDLKKHVQRLLVKTKGSKNVLLNQMMLVLIKKYNAFRNFYKLRWIDLKEDDFTILPAFQRITREIC